MRTGKILLIVTAVLFVVFLAACASQSSATTASTSGSGATAVSSDCSGVPTPSQDMDALIRSKLLDHHSIDRVYSAQHTREEWSATLDRMIGYGAQISQNEKQQIIDYLVCFHP